MTFSKPLSGLLAGLACAFGLLAVGTPPALAQGAATANTQPSNISELVAKAYPVMDSLGTLLLYQLRTGKHLDTLPLLASLGSDLPDNVRLRYQRYLHATDAAERLATLQDLEFELSDRLNALSRASGYLAPLATHFDAFDAAQGRLPLRDSMDVNGESGRADYQCAGIVPGAVASACVSVANLDANDPVFQYIPLNSAQIAGQLAGAFQAGALLFYAQLLPTAAYQGPSGLPADIAAKGVTGSQPTRIATIYLVDKASGKILTSGQAQAPAVAQTQPQTQSTIQPAPAAPALTAALPTTPAATPASPTGAPTTPPGAAAAPALETSGTDDLPPGFTPLPPQADFLELDKFLSLLSYTVYADSAVLPALQSAESDLKAEMDRIANDPMRAEIVRQKELKADASKLEDAQRKVDALQSMLSLRSQISTQYGAKLINSPPFPKVNYLHYRLRDGRDVVVFRGTSGKEDLETDFQLAMTPETVAQLGATAHGGSMTAGMASLMQDHTAPGQGTPQAFVSADKLVQSIVRSGVPAAKIILTGHSLGGGLAQYAGLRNGVGWIVTFNTAPLNSDLRLNLPLDQYAGQIRHYVAWVPGESYGDPGTLDPVSQSATSVGSLQVIGKQYQVAVCNDLGSPEYVSFSNKVQGLITRKTVGWIAKGKFQDEHKAADQAGSAVGYVSASTDNQSSADATKALSGGVVTGAAAVSNCVDHPFLCSAKAVAGGVASIAASATMSRMWTLYSAHRMRNIFEAMNGLPVGGCPRPLDNMDVNH